jgi:hypothetical protein
VKASNADPADVASIDAIITTAYDSISGPAGKRDWNRMRSLFIPGARLIPTAKTVGAANPGSEVAPQVLDIEGFIARIADYSEKNAFFEPEIAPRVEQFGHIAHVWSTYESRHNVGDYWQQESTEHPLPEKYLQGT